MVQPNFRAACKCSTETPLVSASPPNEDTVLPACTVFSHVVRDCCRIGRDAALTTNAHVVDFKYAIVVPDHCFAGAKLILECAIVIPTVLTWLGKQQD